MSKFASFQDEVYQAPLLSSDIEHECKKHQPYFEFERNGESFLIGLDDILTCIAIAEKVDAIPQISKNFWDTALERYGVAFHEIEIE